MARLTWFAALVLASPAIAAAQADVESAEASEPEAVPAPPAPVQLRPEQVRFRANLDGVHVHYAPDPVLEDDAAGGVRLRLLPESRFSELCLAPCERDLPQTHLALAFSRGGALSRSIEPFGVDGPTSVEIDWFDRSGERLAGGLVLGTGIGVALITMLSTAVTAALDAVDEVGVGVGVGVSTALLGAALGVGLYLLLLEDSASFRATPLPDAAPGVFSEDWD